MLQVNLRRAGLLLLILATAFLMALIGIVQGPANAATFATPLPPVTLVPPTLLPPFPTPTATPPLSESVLARIRRRATAGKKALLIVGIPYNIGGFAHLTESGDPEGFEVDIARAIADDWGVDLQFKQVTRQNALNMLLSGQVDLLMGQVLLSREQQTLLDYSDPIFASRQVALALSDYSGDIKTLNGKTVGIVIGSRSEDAFREWVAANNVQATVSHYIMLDDALRALSNKQIVAIIGDRWELDQRAGKGQITGIQLLNGTFRVEPYAIAMPRYDANLRTLVNRTLQRLADSKRLDPIYDTWFPKDLMPVEDRVIPSLIWTNLSNDLRTLDKDFPTDLLMPTNPVVARIKSGQPLRVAGLGAPPDLGGSPAALENFNQAMITEMARRWGVQVSLIPNSYGNGENLLTSGQADLAIGLEPHWSTTDRIDFVGLYAQHGYRIMARVGSGVVGFDSLFTGRRSIGYYKDDQAAFEFARKTAVNAGILEDSISGVPVTSDADAVDLVFNNNVRLFYGDGFRLVPLVQANGPKVVLTDKIYNPKPVAFGVQRNDADFRVLVDVTLQEMTKDGTYQKLWKDKFGQGDPLTVIPWPGSSTVFGVKTTG